jgi:hypothetical protein
VEAVFHALPGLGLGRVPALGTAGALAVIAAFRGGPLAALAVSSLGSGLCAFLVLDHFAARLALHPQAAAGLLPLALAQALRLSSAALVVLLVFGGLQARPHSGLDAATIDELSREKMGPVYLQLAFFAGSGAAVVYYASRLLRRRRDAREPVVEQLVAERGSQEALPERPEREKPAYAGRRGAVVLAYVRFLAEAAAGALVRRPDQTPEEIAARLGGEGAALPRLTGLFSRARYGPDEPSEADVGEADALSGRLRLWLQSRRESGKPASSRHSPASPSVRTT